MQKLKIIPIAYPLIFKRVFSLFKGTFFFWFAAFYEMFMFRCFSFFP